MLLKEDAFASSGAEEGELKFCSRWHELNTSNITVTRR